MAKASRKSASPESSPVSENGKVRSRRRNRTAPEPRSRAAPYSAIPPRRTSNASRRQREYLTASEIDKVLKACAKVGRHGHRDRTLILLARPSIDF